MKRMKKFLIASMCVAAIGAIAAPITGAVLSGKAADTPTWEEINLETSYVRDDTLSIPDRSISINGNAYDATIRLVYPDGKKSIVESGDMALTQPGQYTLIYEAKDDSSVLYTDEIPFLVADKLWSTSNPKSSIEYGKVGSTNALMVKLAKNDVLSFNRIIDLSDLTLDDALIRAFINPEIVGTYEFDKLVFTFTDVTDPTQTLTIRGNRSSTNNQRFASYWTSAGPEQTLGGWDPNAGYFSNHVTDGIRGRHAMNASFYSQVGAYGSQYVGGCTHWDETADKCSFKITYDTNDVKTYINDTWIADHDNGEYYEKEPLWRGFPSNKVLLTVEAADCVGEAANFCISELYGYDFTQENVFVEQDAPEITVDVDEKYVSVQNGNNVMIPTAVKGGYYPVPTASAFDAYSGDVKVERKVYHNYISETNRKERPIKNDTFLVRETGDYTIVYTATDAMGNTSEVLYKVTAVKELKNPLAITVDSANAKISGVCGEKITVADYEATGGSGDVNVTVTASCGDTTLDVTKGYFIPEQAGEWTVTYEAKDYAGIEEEASYTVNVELGTEPIFVEDPFLPKYIISDIPYTVPVVKANDYSTGTKVECVADMVLKDANGETSYKAGESFTPVVNEENPVVTLIFKVGEAEYVKEIPAIIALKKNGNRSSVYIDKMFIGDNFEAERTQNGLKMTAQEDGNTNWMFANALVARNSSITVKGIKGSSIFSTMKVTFTDYMDEKIAVTMYIENQKNGLARVNFGDLNRELNKGFNLGSDESGNALDEFTFSYKLDKFYVDSLAVNVTTDDNGNAFNGFPSGRVYISMETENVTSGSCYFIKQFDNHVMTMSTADRTQPRVAITGNYGGMHLINSTYTITPALASDTIDATVSATVTVKTPTGEIVSDVNGLALENVPGNQNYQIKLTQYGQYIVEYVAVDCTSAKGTASYAINVFDKKLPQATLETTWSNTAKVGDTVVLPEIYVSDDASSIEEMKVFRYVRNPRGDATVFGQDYIVTASGAIQYYRYSFTFNHAGVYTFVNVVYDAAGNQRLVEYTVTVEE